MVADSQPDGGLETGPSSGVNLGVAEDSWGDLRRSFSAFPIITAQSRVEIMRSQLPGDGWLDGRLSDEGLMQTRCFFFFFLACAV